MVSNRDMSAQVDREWNKLWKTDDWWAVWEDLLKISGYGRRRQNTEVQFGRLFRSKRK